MEPVQKRYASVLELADAAGCWSICIRLLSVPAAVLKDPDKSHIREGKLVLAHISRGTSVLVAGT